MNKYKWIEVPNKTGWYIMHGFYYNGGARFISKRNSPVYINREYAKHQDKTWNKGSVFDLDNLNIIPNKYRWNSWYYPIECFDNIRVRSGAAENDEYYNYEDREWANKQKHWEYVTRFYYIFDRSEGGRARSNRLSIAYVQRDKRIVIMNKLASGFERHNELKDTDWSLIKEWELFDKGPYGQNLIRRFFGRFFNKRS